MKEYTLPTPVAVTTIGDLKISTVHLGSFHTGLPYETGEFATESGEGKIIARWATVEEALKNHAWLVQHEINHILARDQFINDNLIN
jgi:hypothetical protein